METLDSGTEEDDISQHHCNKNSPKCSFFTGELSKNKELLVYSNTQPVFNIVFPLNAVFGIHILEFKDTKQTSQPLL